MSTETAITFTGVRTVGIPVADQDRALEFYQRTLGFQKRLDGEFAPRHSALVFPEHSRKKIRDTDGKRLSSSTVKSS